MQHPLLCIRINSDPNKLRETKDHNNSFKKEWVPFRRTHRQVNYVEYEREYYNKRLDHQWQRRISDLPRVF